MNVKIIFNSLRDILRLYFSPVPKNGDYSFAFLVHARDFGDVYKKFPFLKIFPHWMVSFFTMHMRPVIVSEITGLKSQIDHQKNIKGWVIGFPMTAHQMMENRSKALKRILQSAKLAEKMGAKIIGLGALTSSLSRGGLDLIDHIKHSKITTGHAYTAYNIISNVEAVTKIYSLNKKAIKIAIVGAAGSVGSSSAMLAAKLGYSNFILIDLPRKIDYFQKLNDDLQKINPDVNVTTSHQIGDLLSADIVITATNAPEALVRSEDVKSGTIIVDDAQPSDISPELLERKDVLVLEAGVVHTNGVKSNFNFGLKHRTDNFCCLAEVLILSANNWNDHYVINRATIEHIERVAELGKKLGFTIAEFQNYKELITADKIEGMRIYINKEKCLI